VKKKILFLLIVTSLLSSCDEKSITIRPSIEINKEDVFLNKCIYSNKEDESKIVTYITKSNRPVVAKKIL